MSTSPNGESPLEERIAEIQAAIGLVIRLAADGDRAWRMSIPAQDDDSDMLLMRVLARAEKDTAEVVRLTAEREDHGPNGRNVTNAQHLAMRERALAAEAEAARYREALKPFAEAARLHAVDSALDDAVVHVGFPASAFRRAEVACAFATPTEGGDRE